ncbi:MAG: hypothetical protein Q7S36_00055 [Candidatus Liptonbacteria bacterium]|nr:hypothetical protein [Candidatus Liptonbacteria bacterium]
MIGGEEMSFSQIIFWYGIAWVISLLALNLPYRLSGGRLMFGPVRHLLLLDDCGGPERWRANAILVLFFIFLPIYAITQCLTMNNWRLGAWR